MISMYFYAQKIGLDIMKNILYNLINQQIKILIYVQAKYNFHDEKNHFCICNSISKKENNRFSRLCYE
jgi:hypothetical protein